MILNVWQGSEWYNGCCQWYNIHCTKISNYGVLFGQHFLVSNPWTMWCAFQVNDKEAKTT